MVRVNLVEGTLDPLASARVTRRGDYQTLTVCDDLKRRGHVDIKQFEHGFVEH